MSLQPATIWTPFVGPNTAWTSLSDPNAILLLEDGTALLLEDGAGDHLLEYDPPTTIWTPLSDPATH